MAPQLVGLDVFFHFWVTTRVFKSIVYKPLEGPGAYTQYSLVMGLTEADVTSLRSNSPSLVSPPVVLSNLNS